MACCYTSEQQCLHPPEISEGGVLLSSNFQLDRVGEVTLALTPAGLSWVPVQSTPQGKFLINVKHLAMHRERGIGFSHVYATELNKCGGSVSGDATVMHFFTVHAAGKKSKKRPWVLAAYTFGHAHVSTCQLWVSQINTFLKMETRRPKSLMVFVHPTSGKGKGRKSWESVAPIFSRAKVRTKVMVTERAGHASDVMKSISEEELCTYDGAVAVGGDGLFNELLDGFLSSRLEAPRSPPTSLDNNNNNNNNNNNVEIGNNDNRFRFGIIPAGSTDAVVLCTTGYRDAITSALQIVLGERVRLDVAQIATWKSPSESSVYPLVVRYAVSFAGYGFYGDVITESEKYRWMGPRRYDYAGTKVFMRHRSYEAEVAFVGVKEDGSGGSCRTGCVTCSTTEEEDGAMPEWRRVRGRFLSVGAAVISCRNDRAPDGLVVDAHLADGFLHLILIRDCSLPLYLRHLTELARRGGRPLKFDFVDHYKTRAFVFSAQGTSESVWNIDGELFRASRLSARVLRGIITLFATGPEY